MAAKDITDLQVCRACLAHSFGRYKGALPTAILQKITGESFKVCVRATDRAVKRGLVDYGTSLDLTFLTEKGRALLDEYPSEL